MRNIYFFKPFEANYINKTTRIYCDLLLSIPNVCLIDIYNFKEIKYEPDSIVIYLPSTLMGSTITTFDNLMYRLKYVYDTKNLDKITFSLLNEYFLTFIDSLNESFNNVCVLYELDLHDLIDSKIQKEFVSVYNSLLMFTGPELFDLKIHSTCNEFDLDDEKVLRGLIFLNNHANRIISLPHVISTEEIISELPIFSSKNIISIPGVKYFLRKEVYSFLKKNIFSSFLSNSLDWIVMKIFYQIPIAYFKHKLLHFHFKKIISKSLFSFTCGSTSGYLVRKFFEIPSFGSILITYDYEFLKNCGFLPNKHYLPVRDVSDLLPILKKDFIFNNFSNLNLIKYNALSLIRQNHSSAARFQQLCNTFKVIESNSFHGSYWENGIYIFRKHA